MAKNLTVDPNFLNKCLQCELQPLGLRLADVFDYANDAIIIADTDHKIVGWNKRAEEIFGFKKDEIAGKSVIKTVVAPSKRKKASCVVESLDAGSAFSGEVMHQTKDGREIPGRVSIRGIFGDSGQKLGFLGICTDISEIKRTEERLRRQNRDLKAFREVAAAIAGPMRTKETLERAVELIVKALSGDAGAIFLLNGERAVFSGLAHHGASERLVAQLASYSSKGSFSGRIVELGKGLVIRDARLPKNNGSVLPAAIKAGFRSLIGVPLVGKEGTIGTLEVVSRTPSRFDRRDLRLLVALGSQVTASVENGMLREELSKSLGSKTRLAKEARHRLTNNLQAVASLLSTAVESEQWTGNGKAAVDSAIRRISGMAAIQQQMDVDGWEPLELVEVMERIETCIREIHGGQHEMTFTTKGRSLKLPPALASSLAIAVNELVWNSCVHGFDRADNGFIAVEATVANCTARVQVKDDGKGIPEDFDLERDASTGLSIVRNLVERDLDGRLTLRRENGTMATITWTVSPAPKG